jgi:molybdate transport system regulatory protein
MAARERKAKRKPAERDDERFGVGGGLWFERRQRRFLGERRIALLEQIDALGSITRAAKAVGLSYKGAWDAVDAVNNLAEAPVVRGTVGGKGGGGSELTDHGRDLVRLYRQLEAGHRRVLARIEADHPHPERLRELLNAITLKTSARNQFRGRVKAVRRGAVNADVVLDIGSGLEIFANVTNEAVDDLGLKRGREAIALIKASFVMLTTDADVRTSARNKLVGGPVNSEVKIELSDSRTLIAVITTAGLEALGLREGVFCCALVKASHVLVAVND